MKLKAGTRVELYGMPAFGGFPGVAPETAKVRRPRAEHGDPGEGWNLLRFDNTGGSLWVHEEHYRVIDNASQGGR